MYLIRKKKKIKLNVIPNDMYCISYDTHLTCVQSISSSIITCVQSISSFYYNMFDVKGIFKRRAIIDCFMFYQGRCSQFMS